MSHLEPDNTVELSEAQAALVASFKSAYRSMDRRKGRETRWVGGSKVSQAQFDVLMELRKNGPMPVGELAHSLGLSSASVSQMIDRLSEQGHVTRTRSEEDRRVVRVELSERGVESLAPIVARWRRGWKAALAEVPDEDLEIASRVLDRVASLYEETPA